jgi:cholesterol oxidase
MFDWDFIIVGSGFGGSVSALRLVEKGYRVLLLEKGRRLGPADFPKTNWDLKRWMWRPALGWHGLFQMKFFPHVTVLSGVGVGGGSLVYANTLPIPGDGFFNSQSWRHLAPWKDELAAHYQTVRRMLGAQPTPFQTVPDRVLEEMGREMGRPHHPTTVAVYFGEPGVTVNDPYFDGLGPSRTGCNHCGGCMLGCRFGAKNTLDKNYLHLAESKGLVLRPETEVSWVKPLSGGGYAVDALQGLGPARRERVSFTTRNIVFSGGVMGTIPLLLELKRSPEGLPELSDRLGQFVRTNSEALISVTTRRRDLDLSKGVAIGSILETDEHSHLEPVRYPEGAGFFRLFGAPPVQGSSFFGRLVRTIIEIVRHPVDTARVYLVRDWARSTTILLYMRSLEGHLTFRLGRDLFTAFRRDMTSRLEAGPAPSANIPEANALAARVAEKLDGKAMTLVTETFGGIPTTAHILGGACMGDRRENGVIDHRHRVFGYEGLYVVDGSAVSANPGVNPSLTIAALAERAMTFIPERSEGHHAGDRAPAE